ncbi:MAG: hypothetical protein JWL88_344 [Parcubacteria group bacterium]|nr:hypothetical protein [Parcubacteria group bacterium]
MLALQGRSAALAFFLVAELHRPAPARVPRSARQFPVMCFHALLYIVRAPRVERAVRALKDVYEVASHVRTLHAA